MSSWNVAVTVVSEGVDKVWRTSFSAKIEKSHITRQSEYVVKRCHDRDMKCMTDFIFEATIIGYFMGINKLSK
jgi:hypothetical protein